MEWFILGGIMMWPLLLISIMALAIIFERMLFYYGFSFPPQDLEALLTEALRTGEMGPIVERMQNSDGLNAYAQAVAARDMPDREAALGLAGSSLMDRADANLGVLGMLGRLAPLVGLLGTIIGMITTFSRIASAHGAVDMPLLAGGIWQALITTAAGLIIAIPCVFTRHFFLRRNQRLGKGLQDIGNTALSLDRREKREWDA